MVGWDGTRVGVCWFCSWGCCCVSESHNKIKTSSSGYLIKLILSITEFYILVFGVYLCHTYAGCHHSIAGMVDPPARYCFLVMTLFGMYVGHMLLFQTWQLFDMNCPIWDVCSKLIQRDGNKSSLSNFYDVH